MFKKNSTLTKVLRHKFAVTMKNNEGTFVGILLEVKGPTMVFAQCSTVPDFETTNAANEMAGLVHIFIDNVAYMQELS